MLTPSLVLRPKNRGVLGYWPGKVLPLRENPEGLAILSWSLFLNNQVIVFFHELVLGVFMPFWHVAIDRYFLWIYFFIRIMLLLKTLIMARKLLLSDMRLCQAMIFDSF